MKRIFWTCLIFSFVFGNNFVEFPRIVTGQETDAASEPAYDAAADAGSPESSTAEATKSTAKTADDKKKIETVTAEIKPIIVYDSFGGVFESTRTHEVKLDFENWSDLVIKSVVKEGTAVSSGDRLIEFETQSIDKAVAEAEFAAQNAEFDFKNAELEMKQANETFEMDMAIAERHWKNAQEDYDYYLKTELPRQLDDLQHSEKTAGYYLEYSKDELDQLQQMYTADELTEESEAIVLKRAERDVESAERSMDRTLTRLKRQQGTEIPREKIQQEESLKRASLNHAKAMITLPIQKQKAEIALAQADFALKNKAKLLADLRADQAKMTVPAPANGIVYFGSCERGKWKGVGSNGSRQLEPDDKLAANAVAITLVEIGELTIRASVDESDLSDLAPRLRGKALVTAAGNVTIPVLIKTVSRIPLAENKYDCQILIEKLPAEIDVMPGMSCKLSFQVHENKQALVLPKESVFSDDDGVTHYVYLMLDGQPKRTEVLAGRTTGDQVEILEGVAEGDSVCKAKPK